jgi:hypothetical protein
VVLDTGHRLQGSQVLGLHGPTVEVVDARDAAHGFAGQSRSI